MPNMQGLKRERNIEICVVLGEGTLNAGCKRASSKRWYLLELPSTEAWRHVANEDKTFSRAKAFP
jgi:hypothetical protein